METASGDKLTAANDKKLGWCRQEQFCHKYLEGDIYRRRENKGNLTRCLFEHKDYKDYGDYKAHIEKHFSQGDWSFKEWKFGADHWDYEDYRLQKRHLYVREKCQ